MDWTTVGGFIGLIILVSIIFGYLMKRMDRLEKEVDKKMDMNLCKQKHIEVNTRLEKGDTMFGKVIDKLDDMNDVLIRLDTTLELWKKQYDKNCKSDRH